MSNTRVTRSSVLGKRRAEAGQPSASKTPESQLPTPDSTPKPKRPRTSLTLNEGDANKENIPPFKFEAVNDLAISPRATRALRRSSTEATFSTPSRQSLRRNASTSSLIPATPVGAISHLTLATPPPTPPTSLLPIYARARALLRATSNNSTIQIAGRDVERTTIRDFISSDSTSSLYISGAPGTGKTALVYSILRGLEEEADQVKLIAVNCMALKNVDELWTQLAEELDAKGKHKATPRSKKVKGREAVESLLASRKTKCIIILDELDHVASCPTILTTIFSLPSSSNFRLIGIANTHTLTSSVTKLPKGAHVQTLHFSPYTSAQLLDILNSRLHVLCEDTPEGDAERKKFLPLPTLTLLAKKVAALTGDVRSLLEVLRGAIDLAVATTAPQSPPTNDEVNPLNAPAPTVTPSHILGALKAYTPTKSSSATTPSSPSTSETINKVRNTGLHARIALITLILASKRAEANLPITESPSSSTHSTPKSPIKRSQSLPSSLPFTSGSGIESSLLYTSYTQILARGENGLLSAVSRSEFTDLLGMLEGVGLTTSASISCLPATISPSKSGRRAFGRSASFGGVVKAKGSSGEVKLVEGIRLDEVLRGLGVNEKDDAMEADDVDPREEEVRILWTRESSRIEKDIKVAERLRAKIAPSNAFGDAMED